MEVFVVIEFSYNMLDGDSHETNYMVFADEESAIKCKVAKNSRANIRWKQADKDSSDWIDRKFYDIERHALIKGLL